MTKINIPINNARVILFTTLPPALIVCRLFDGGHSNWCEVISHCSFDLRFSNNEHVSHNLDSHFFHVKV